jgi:hypothetical protein
MRPARHDPQTDRTVPRPGSAPGCAESRPYLDGRGLFADHRQWLSEPVVTDSGWCHAQRVFFRSVRSAFGIRHEQPSVGGPPTIVSAITREKPFSRASHRCIRVLYPNRQSSRRPPLEEIYDTCVGTSLRLTACRSRSRSEINAMLRLQLDSSGRVTNVANSTATGNMIDDSSTLVTMPSNPASGNSRAPESNESIGSLRKRITGADTSTSNS